MLGASGVAWPSLLARLRDLVDLEGSARECGALRRRRGVADAGVLLRLALVYGGTGLSLRGTAAWAAAAGVADLSDVALLYRLQGAEGWLGWLVREFLSKELAALAAGVAVAGGWRVRLVDGTGIGMAGPGGKALFRLHAAFDLAARRFDALELTSGGAAESLARFTAGPGEVLVADRFYAKAKGVHHVVAQGGHVVVRRGLTACRLLAADGRKLDAKAILALARANPTLDLAVLVPPPEGSAADPVPARLIIRRKPGRRGRAGPGQGHAQGHPPRLCRPAQADRGRRPLDGDDHPAARHHVRRRGLRPLSPALADRVRLQTAEEPDGAGGDRRPRAAPGQGRGLRQADPGDPRREPARPGARPFPHPLTGRPRFGAWPACCTSGSAPPCSRHPPSPPSSAASPVCAAPSPNHPDDEHRSSPRSTYLNLAPLGFAPETRVGSRPLGEATGKGV